jgi:hypothetical protein
MLRRRRSGRLQREERREGAAEHAFVVGEEEADHRTYAVPAALAGRGRVAAISKRSPSRVQVSSPPAAARRSARDCRPVPAASAEVREALDLTAPDEHDLLNQARSQVRARLDDYLQDQGR